MSEHVRLAEFYAILCERMGPLAPALATLKNWVSPGYLRRHRHVREIMPEPRRLAFGRAHHWRRADVEAFADALLSTDGAARLSIRPQD